MVFTGKTSQFLGFPVQKLVTGSSEQSNKNLLYIKGTQVPRRDQQLWLITV